MSKSAMHINVRDFLVESVGYSRSYKIAGERPTMDSVILTDDVAGEVTIVKLESASLGVEGSVSTEIQLECHRCLRTFAQPVHLKFKQVFAEEPRDDDMPIEHGEIDLAPLIEQEVILSLPIKILDRSDCPGIVPAAEASESVAEKASIKHRARIIKEER